MAEYYLISQLPSLDGVGENTPLPITQERFLELCNDFLGEKAKNELKQLTLCPKKDNESFGSGLLAAWNENEQRLRLALGRVRAAKMKKPFEMANNSLPIELIKVANTAAEMENPMEAEKYLSRYRLAFLEALRPMDNFSKEFVFYYGLKLKLLLRIRQFDTELGEATYKSIYNSIINKERLEEI